MNEFQDNTDDEEYGMALFDKTVKHVRTYTLVRSERSISKIGVQNTINNYLNDSSPYIFELRSRINKFGGFLTYK